MITLRRNRYKETMNWLPEKRKGKWLVATLEQFVDQRSGKRYTYMPDYDILEETICIFRVYRKKFSFFEKVKIFFGSLSYRKGIIVSQLHG